MKKIYLFCFFAFFVSMYAHAQNPADLMLDFIRKNKDKASLYLSQNDTVIAKLNENKMMPLASTVKILIAIEFAKQVAKGDLNENQLVGLKELERYYLPQTDGNAHSNWIAYEKKKGYLKEDSVILLDVARGMIMFSSNANTEYLLDLLGLDEVKNNIELLGLKQHTAIYPMVASLFMYQNPMGKKEADIIKAIKKLSGEQYARYIYDMHKALKYDTILKSKFRPQDLTMKMQKVWSDRLPASTTKEYVRLCSILNNRAYFDEDTYAILSLVMETIMENPANKQWLKHAGMKGGSTAWVLTKALYATNKKGQRIEMAYFFNNLTTTENDMLQGLMNNFELAVLSDESFRKKLGDVLK